MENKPEPKEGVEAAVPSEVTTTSSSVSLTQGRGGILGIKAGMTQFFTPEGDAMAVTVIDLEPNVITQVKTNAKDGYQSVQVAMLPKKLKNATKSEQGRAKAYGDKVYHHYQEFRLPEDSKLEGMTVGQMLSPAFLKEGDLVDLTSISKGKGFQGGMKRHHFAGGFKSHGCSVSHRSLGSIGNRADPGRCFKNKKMPGQMGNARVTVQNVQVIKVDTENGLLLVHGSVPGPRRGIVAVRRAIKTLPDVQGKR